MTASLMPRAAPPHSASLRRSHRSSVRVPGPVGAQPALRASPGCPASSPSAARAGTGWCPAACTRPTASRADLLDAFLRDSARDGEQVVALQVRAGDVALFRSRGFRVDAFGSTFALELPRFSFAGTKRMKLRNRIKRARDAGVTVVELGRDRACPPGLWRRLADISQAWLTTKGGHELDLLVGEMGEPGRSGSAAVRRLRSREQPLAFITYVPAWGERPGVLHDLTRRAPDAPAGVMELINATASPASRPRRSASFISASRRSWSAWAGPRGAGDHWLVPRLVRFIGRWGRAIYPARAQLQYKQKWAPEIVEPEHDRVPERVAGRAVGAAGRHALAGASVAPTRRLPRSDAHENRT